MYVNTALMSNAYYHTKQSVDEYIELAKNVNGQALIAKLSKLLPANATVLELGSGPGTDWRILSNTHAVTGSDYSTQFIKHLQAQHPTGTFLQLNAATLATDKTFAGIYANKVLHHLTDEELAQSVKRQHAILNANGIVCLSFWQGSGTETFKGMFVNYHQQAELRSLFEQHFEILLLEPYAEFEANDSLLLIGRKKG